MQKKDFSVSNKSNKCPKNRIWLYLIPVYLLAMLTVLSYLLFSPLPPQTNTTLHFSDIIYLRNIYNKLRTAQKKRKITPFKPMELRLTTQEFNAILRGMTTVAVTTGYAKNIPQEQLLPITNGSIHYDAGNINFDLPIYNTDIRLLFGGVIKVHGTTEIKIDNHNIKCQIRSLKIGKLPIPDDCVARAVQKYLPLLNDNQGVRNILAAVESLSYDDNGDVMICLFPNKADIFNIFIK